MPVQVSYPGVYIQEVSSGVKVITGVSTSIAAFLGRTAQGPINKAVRCLSYTDFLRTFGGPHPLSDLATSVKQFFDNGGTDCYIVRLAKLPPRARPQDPQPGSALVALRRLALPEAPGQNRNVLMAIAKAPGIWGQDIKLEVDYNTSNPDDTFNLHASYEAGGQVVMQETHSNLSMDPISPRFAPNLVTQSSTLIDLQLHADMGDPSLPASFINTIANTPAGYSQSRRVFNAGGPVQLRDDINLFLTNQSNDAENSTFLINVNGTRDVLINLNGIAALLPSTAGTTIIDIASALQTFINPKLAQEVPGASLVVTWDVLPPANTVVLRLTSGFGDFKSVNIKRAGASNLAANLFMGLDQGGIEVARYSNMRPVPNGTFYWGNINWGDFTAGINAFASLNQNALTQISFDTTPPTNVALNLVTGGVRMYEQAAGGFDGVKEKLLIIAETVNKTVDAPCTAEVWGYHLFFKRKVGGLNDTSVVTTSAGTFGNGFVTNTRRYSLGTVGTSQFQFSGTVGSDGGVPGVAEFQGDPESQTGFYALDTVDLFNLMVIPGDREISESTFNQIIGPASIYCNKERAFLLLDAPESWTVGGRPKADAGAVNSLRSLTITDHTAIFYPKIQYSDAGLKKYIGASGIIAGLMARTDSARGVWKAPAGIEADLRGVLDVEINLTDLENGVLNKLGVNCIRKFPVGIVNWGARTLRGSDDIGSEWKYIPVRRLALFLEESLFRGTQWVVFEPNDEPLWAMIRQNLRAFMLGLFREGAFQGATPDKAFYVKCDGETTTANDRNHGIVNIEVGFAPLKPAEFVVIKIQQIADIES